MKNKVEIRKDSGNTGQQNLYPMLGILPLV